MTSADRPWRYAARLRDPAEAFCFSSIAFHSVARIGPCGHWAEAVSMFCECSRPGRFLPDRIWEMNDCAHPMRAATSRCGSPSQSSHSPKRVAAALIPTMITKGIRESSTKGIATAITVSLMPPKKPPTIVTERVQEFFRQLKKELGSGWDYRVKEISGMAQPHAREVLEGNKGAGMLNAQRLAKAFGIKMAYFTEPGLKDLNYKHHLERGVRAVEPRSEYEGVRRFLAGPLAYGLSDEWRKRVAELDFGGWNPGPGDVAKIVADLMEQEERLA